jgi:hypothetical protein
MGDRMAWESWAYGLVAAFIGGGSGALSAGIGTMVVAPAQFNVEHPALLIKAMCWTFFAAGIVPFFSYLHQQPLPPVITVTTVETVEQKKSPPAVVTTTVETTETKDAG